MALFGKKEPKEKLIPSDIKVLSVNAGDCEKCVQALNEALGELGLVIVPETVIDINEIKKIGTQKMPMIAFDGRIVLSGSIPRAKDVKKLLG